MYAVFLNQNISQEFNIAKKDRNKGNVSTVTTLNKNPKSSQLRQSNAQLSEIISDEKVDSDVKQNGIDNNYDHHDDVKYTDTEHESHDTGRFNLPVQFSNMDPGYSI